MNALTRHYLEWIIELRKAHDVVSFFGQDDKTKVVCGDAVPIASGVRGNNKGIIALRDKRGLKAMNHDFHYANLIAFASLECNMPDEISGSFFVGDEGGNGQTLVTEGFHFRSI